MVLDVLFRGFWNALPVHLLELLDRLLKLGPDTSSKLLPTKIGNLGRGIDELVLLVVWQLLPLGILHIPDSVADVSLRIFERGASVVTDVCRFDFLGLL